MVQSVEKLWFFDDYFFVLLKKDEAVVKEEGFSFLDFFEYYVPFHHLRRIFDFGGNPHCWYHPALHNPSLQCRLGCLRYLGRWMNLCSKEALVHCPCSLIRAQDGTSVANCARKSYYKAHLLTIEGIIVKRGKRIGINGNVDKTNKWKSSISK